MQWTHSPAMKAQCPNNKHHSIQTMCNVQWVQLQARHYRELHPSLASKPWLSARIVSQRVWQAVWHHLLPYSTGGIATGVILAMSRAIGESAPLITIGALTFIAFLPPAPILAHAPFVSMDWLFSPFTALPIQMFNWVSRPGDEFQANAAAAGLFLMLITLSMNGAAILLRRHAQRNIKW